MLYNPRIGFTTTIPVEIVLAAGATPVDLNNIFVTHPEADSLMRRAEMDGYPRSVCSWIKGIYGAVMKLKPVDRLIVVTEGDCSNTRSLHETFQIADDFPLLTFNYPHDRDRKRLRREMEKLADSLETTLEAAEQWREKLRPLRKKLRKLDELTWKSGKVTGAENHLWMVSSSDFNGDPEKYERELDAFLKEAENRTEHKPGIRLAFAGVPPIISDLYDYLSGNGAQIVLNEMQRQFSMPYDCDSLEEQYLRYRYPYDVFYRLEDLEQEIRKRNIQGLIHYVQAFCHRGIEDIAMRKKLEIPILTLEGDQPGPLDARTTLRLDIFLEMLGGKLEGQTLP